MKIDWLAHSCFTLRNQAGSVLLTDPYDESTGYEVPHVQADVVTSSHGHGDHAHFEVLKGDYILFNTPGKHQACGFTVTGIETKHDDEGGAKRGDNLVFVIESEHIRLCHCGDLGHMLTEEQLQAIGHVDILMVPVGGYYTIDAQVAREVVRALDPKVVIPMHYKTEQCPYPIAPIEAFLELMRKDEYAISMYHDSTKDYTEDGLPKRHTVLVMDHAY